MEQIVNLDDNDQHNMKKKTTHFLIVSLIIMIAVSVGVLSFFAYSMNKKSMEAVNGVGDIYMHGMSERISFHFDTTITLRLAQVETMIHDVPPESLLTGESALDMLIGSGKQRDFGSLAFCSGDGAFEFIYGTPFEVIDPPPFLASLAKGDKKVAVARNENGEKIVLIAVPAEYHMSNGGTSIALVAAISADYINEMLSLDEDGTLTYSHIIRRDGSYVIRNIDSDNNNYFDRIRDTFSELNGKNAEQYVTELRGKMEENEDYSVIMQMNGERRHLYCTHLPYSEWYLVTVMPYGTLDRTINLLSEQILIFLFVGICVVLMVLAFIFAKYFRMTQKHIQQLNIIRQEAINANKAKSEFLSNMSHDIRTPMNAIVGMTAIATTNIDDKQQVQNCLRKIALSSKHLLGLINDILDMSKIESGKMTLSMEQISLRDIMDSIVSIVQPQIKIKNQKFDVFISDIESENVYCDSVRLNQVLLNLLSNAIKFTPDGGEISVTMYEEESPKGEDFVRVQLFVKDSGIGMTPEFKAKIFESFAREDNKRVHKTEGTGLGMAITKYILDAMGGAIEVNSEQGKGTEFHVTLDLERATEEFEEMILPDWNMLVVDDDMQLCETTVAVLKDIGMKADWTLDGETAVEMVEKHHNAGDDYKIILIDWKLPGIDGIETARRIRSHVGNDFSILLISAYDWADIEDEARAAGVNGFISKPLFKSTLFYGLKQFTENTPLQPETKEETAVHDLEGIRVLVAEDNDLNWEIAYELLTSQFGLELERAENGQICVDKFKASEEGYYDAILMDIRMPVMTGYGATEEIRKLSRTDADLPIIAMTADAFSEDVKKCIDCGMNAHVAKPIDTAEIHRVLKKYLK